MICWEANILREKLIFAKSTPLHTPDVKSRTDLDATTAQNLQKKDAALSEQRLLEEREVRER
jgi:hypothetical protein